MKVRKHHAFDYLLYKKKKEEERMKVFFISDFDFEDVAGHTCMQTVPKGKDKLTGN